MPPKNLTKVEDLKAKTLAVFENEEFSDEEKEEALANLIEAMAKTSNDPRKKVTKDMSAAKSYLDAYRKRKQNPEGMKKAVEESSEEVSIASLFEGSEFSEEFKEKVETLFEAAVTLKVKDIADCLIEELEEKYTSEFEAKLNAVNEESEEKVQSYLELMVESWIKENRVAIESGLKMEIYENFVGGMKALFEQSQINIPEEKVDMVESLEEKVDSLQEQLNASMDARAEMKREIDAMRKTSIIKESCEGLTDVQAEKLKLLAEDIAFEDEPKFSSKLNTIKESFFANASPKSEVPAVVTDSPVILEEVQTPKKEEQLPEDVQSFLNALNSIK